MMNHKGTSVAEIRPGIPFQGIFLLQSAVSGTSRNGEPYWKIEVSDFSGKLDAYLWGRPAMPPRMGQVIWLSGTGRRLGNRIIGNIISMIELSAWSGCPFLLAPHDRPLPQEAPRVSALLDRIEDSELRHLCRSAVSEPNTLKATLQAPGSLRHHHAYPGGLIRHTRETMEIVLNHAQGLKQPEIDLLLGAAFLHDLGKAYEYDQYRLSPRGTLVGHDITLLEMLSPIMDELWDINHPTRIALLHFLVAKPAPQWTGIRHPRSALVNILRFADKFSGEMDLQSSRKGGNQFTSLLSQGCTANVGKDVLHSFP